MADPLDPRQLAALALARQLIREAAIHDMRPEFYLVDVVGSVVASIKASHGAQHALTIAHGVSGGCDAIAALIASEARG
jgi:hypothetical protein